MAVIANCGTTRDRAPVRAPRRLPSAPCRSIAFLVLVFVALLMFVPFAFSLATSLKTQPEAAQLTFGNMFWPNEPTLHAYAPPFDSNIGRWFFNSAFVALCWIVGRAIMDTLAGYAFARMEFPGRDFMFLLILGTMMVPGIVTVIPKFILLRDLNLLDSLRRADRAVPGRCVRHLPDEAVLRGDPARPRGSGPHRRRQPLPDFPPDRAAEYDPRRRRACHLQLPGQLERVPGAGALHQRWVEPTSTRCRSASPTSGASTTPTGRC